MHFTPQKYFWMKAAILSGYGLTIICSNLAAAAPQLRVRSLLSLFKNVLLEVPQNFKDCFASDGRIQMKEHERAKYLT